MKKLYAAAAIMMIALLLGAGLALASSDLSGTVVETMNSGGYTYALIEKDGAKTWVAVPKTTVTVGQKVTFMPGGAMYNFTSKTLKRTFDVIVFSPGLAK